MVDRHSGMLSIHHTNYSGSKGFLRILREHIQKYGIPVEVATDGASVFVSHKTQDFFKKYNIRHRISTVANPHSNSRSELAVKSMKRLLQEYIGQSGCVDNDAVT